MCIKFLPCTRYCARHWWTSRNNEYDFLLRSSQLIWGNRQTEPWCIRCNQRYEKYIVVLNKGMLFIEVCVLILVILKDTLSKNAFQMLLCHETKSSSFLHLYTVTLRAAAAMPRSHEQVSPVRARHTIRGLNSFRYLISRYNFQQCWVLPMGMKHSSTYLSLHLRS